MKRVLLLSMILSLGFAQISGPCASNPCLNGATCFNAADLLHFMCICSTGYSGTNCEITLPGVCPADFVCMNAGVCTTTSDGYPICLCQAGFTGDTCQDTTQTEDPCSTAVCQNGGSCVSIDSIGYLCQCPDGFDGTNCETEIAPCSSNPCLNGGSCLVSSPDNSRYFCSCPSTYEGVNCEIPAVNCASYPCLNGGTCFTPGGDTDSGFLCVCPATHIGTMCETLKTVSTPCSSMPCLNNGMCVESGENFTCNCLTGFKGSRCEINIDECSSNPCIHGNCVDVYNGFYCECESGWEGLTCNTGSGTVIDPCTSTPCENDGSCLPSLDMSTFLCICTTGFSGDLCETDETEATGSPDLCSSNPCLNGGSCISPVVPGVTYVYCICQQGYVGQYCETEDGGACVANPCLNGGTCNPQPFSPGGYFCTCLTGFSGSLCETDERPPDPCESTPCTNGGTCFTEAFNNDYICLCQIGYSGRHCEIVGPCVSQPCLNGATCLEEPHNNNLFMCYCAPGYVGTTCSDMVSEVTCSPNTCMNGGECMLTSDNPPPPSPFIPSTADFWCQCTPGFTGIYCQVVDPCASSPCLNGASCSHVFISLGTPEAPDGFWCQCTTGFIGTTCSERGPCESDPCMNGGTCIIHAMTAFDPLYGGSFDSSLYTFICECPTGYTGETCSSINLPEDNPCSSLPCQNGGTCFAYIGDTSSSFYCQCPMEFVGDLCQETGPCESSPCQNGATCFPTIISSTLSIFYCICPNGYTGTLCTQPVSDPCSSDPCQNGGSCSIISLPSSDSGFICSCPSTFTGELCESPIPNPCDSNPCLNSGTCFQEIRDTDDGTPTYRQSSTSYVCQCPAGFTGDHCQHSTIDACSSNPCQNQGTCTADGMMLFICTCQPGYMGFLCSEPYLPPEDACLQRPCLNDGTCIMDQTSSSGYICVCDVSYYGERCQYQYEPPVSEPCDELPCLNGGTCIKQGSGYLCDCPTSFMGVHCEVYVTTECIYDNNPYLNGESRTDSCNTCTCDNGSWTCTEFICECMYGSERFANGDHRQESCNTCVCSNGQWFCTEMACDGQCIFIDELYTQGDTRSQDCNICTCVDTEWICSDLNCQADDCKDSDEPRIEDCNECFCKDGQWVCTTKTCFDEGTTNIQFSFPNDFNDIREKEQHFMSELKQDLVLEFNIPTSLIQNMQVSAGSIIVNFDVVHTEDDNVVDLVLETIEYSILSNSYTFTFEGVTYEADPNSFKSLTISDPEIYEDEEEETSILIIAVGTGGALLVFGFIAVTIACVYKRMKVTNPLDSFKEDMSGIPNNILSTKVQQPIHRVRTLPPGYKFNQNDYQ